VTDVVEKDSALVSIEFVENAVNTYPEPKLSSTLESGIGKCFEAGSHVIDLALGGIAHGRGQGIEGSRECGRPNLEGGRHNLTRLTGRELARSDFAPRLI
jgi:hypothetical protein